MACKRELSPGLSPKGPYDGTATSQLSPTSWNKNIRSRLLVPCFETTSYHGKLNLNERKKKEGKSAKLEAGNDDHASLHLAAKDSRAQGLAGRHV
jgi:hypothetical protein